jgi:Fic family protein
VDFICETQRTLVRGTTGELSDAGQLRDRQVVIGPQRSAVEEARFVPCPPGDQLDADFTAWLDWVTKPRGSVPPVVRAALAHYQFETSTHSRTAMGGSGGF